MRNLAGVGRWLLFCVGVSLVVSPSLNAEESELDMDLMQTIEDTNDSLTSNVALEDAEAAEADAKALNELFAVVVEFYQKEQAAGKDVAEAVKLSEKSLLLTNDIASHVKSSDFEAAAIAATDLSRTCKTCHNFYKED